MRSNRAECTKKKGSLLLAFFLLFSPKKAYNEALMRRDAGVVELAALEKQCGVSSPRVRIPLSPPLTLVSNCANIKG